MENLVVVRWLSFPFQSLTALLFLIGKWLWIFDASPPDIFFNEEMLWVAIVFGVLYLLLGFSTLLRFVHLFLNLWKFGKASQDTTFRKVSLFQLIRIVLSGLIFLLGIAIGLLVLLPNVSPRPILYFDGMYEMTLLRHYPEYNFSFIILLALVMGAFWFLQKLLNILSVILLDNWAHLQERYFESAEEWQILTTGTNLMKYGVFVQLFHPFFGYILFNLGLSKTGKGFKSFLPLVMDADDPIENNGKTEPSPIPPIMPNNVQHQDDSQRASTQFCSQCGYRMRER